MDQINVIGIDLAKRVFQIHGVDSSGKAILKKRLSRSQMIRKLSNLNPCLVGLEACASAHFWARELSKMGHTVKIMAPQYVKPYVKTNKNDAADAEAICEAVTRKNMRFVPIKSVAAQDLQAIHRARKRLINNRTGLINEIRGLLGEYGITMEKTVSQFNKKIPLLLDDSRLTPSFQTTLAELYEEYCNICKRIKRYDVRLEREHKQREVCQNLSSIKGIGVIGSTALATVDPTVFKNGREFAAWLGLTPKQSSSGGKDRLLGISKRGDGYLRELLVHGARVFLRWSHKSNDSLSRWARHLKTQKGHNKACVALANKLARICWTIMMENRKYRVSC